MDFQEIRKEYENRGIPEDGIPLEPMPLFREWYARAVELRPASWLEPNAMSLATCDQTGVVSNRYLLLKGVDDNGIRFYTNYQSRKGQQLATNPRAAAALHWPYLGRQVRLEGQVEATSRDDSESYFHSRPRGSQLSAAVSPQSEVVDSWSRLQQDQQELEAALSDQPVPLPENWGGYRLVVDRVEFWQGRTNRLHDRVEYRLLEQQWQRRRLAP